MSQQESRMWAGDTVCTNFMELLKAYVYIARMKEITD